MRDIMLNIEHMNITNKMLLNNIYIMSNLEALFGARTLPQIQSYQSAIRNIRKNAKTKGEKIKAIERQTNYMNLMFNSGAELGGKQGIDTSYFLGGEMGLKHFKKADVDYIFSALNVPYTKTKSSILGNVKEAYNVMRYLEFAGPREPGPDKYVHPQAAHLPGGGMAPPPVAAGEVPPVAAPPPMSMLARRGPDPRISNRPGGLLVAPPIPYDGLRRAPPAPRVPHGGPGPAEMRRPRLPNPRLSNLSGGLPAGAGGRPRRPAPVGGGDGDGDGDIQWGPDDDDALLRQIAQVEHGPENPVVVSDSDHESDDDVVVNLARTNKGRKNNNNSRSSSYRRGGDNDNSRSSSYRRGGDNDNSGPNLNQHGYTREQMLALRRKGKLIGAKGDYLWYEDLAKDEKAEWKKRKTDSARRAYMKTLHLQRDGERATSRIDVGKMRLGGKDAYMS